jgi:energy-coupling factor transport system ATP-binding protein
MIEIDRLTYTYPRTDRPALVDVSLRIDAGQTVLLTGRSGSGKSTLLGAVNGLIPHYYGGRIAGRVVVGGMDTRDHKAHDLAALVGTAFQEPASRFITRQVADELAFGLEAAGLGGAEIARRVRETAERLRLGPLQDRPLDQLSGGEQQRVAVAAALARQPRVLVLDEPTSQLDSESAQGVLDWLRDLCRADGLTTLISEHRLGRLLPEVDRVAALSERGRLEAWGAPAEVLTRLPYGGPLIEAARALGLPVGLSEDALRALRERLLAWRPPPGAAPAGEVRLAARGLGFAFGEGFELHPVDLDLCQGEALAVLGGNGSGKTTLLRCLMGLLAHRGQVQLDGERIEGQPVSVRARHLAYVPQWPSAFLFADTVREELWTTLRYRGLHSQARAPDSVEAMLGVFGLDEVAGRYPRDLSAGERQRTALAAVMIAGPKCVLLDEPTLGMDSASQAQLARRIRRWKRSGLSVMVATHDVEFAAAVSERALVLERGRVAAVGDTAQVLFDRPELRTALQRLTGRARPACVSDLVQETGGEHADD